MLEQIQEDGFSDSENDLIHAYSGNLDLFETGIKKHAIQFKLYVEGPFDDYIWKKFIEDQFLVDIVHFKDENKGKKSAKRRVIKIITEANSKKDDHCMVIGVIDRDIDDSSVLGIRNLYLYDEDDLEGMVLTSASFRETFRTIFLPNHERQFEWLRDRLLDATAEIGKLRSFFYYKPNIKLLKDPSVNDTKFENAVDDPSSLRVSSQLLCQEVLGEAKKTFNQQEMDSLRIALNVYPQYNPPRAYRRGHDAVRLLNYFIKTGGWDVYPESRNLLDNQLTKDLVQPFSDRFFRVTKIYKDVTAWNDTISCVRFFRRL